VARCYRRADDPANSATHFRVAVSPIIEAALEACRLRLRPIVMTSIAFIAGTIPLIFGHGAGAEVRGVTGITVFSGMLGVTLFGLFLTPVFYVALRRLVTRKQSVASVEA